MKRVLSITAFLGLAFILTSAITIMEAPQDPQKKEKTKKHIKIVKIDEEGKKMELDTIIEDDKAFVWQGDTIKGNKAFKWISKDDLNMDSLDQHIDIDFEYEIDNDGEGNIFIMKSGKDGKRIIKELKIDGDSQHGEHEIMMWNNDDGKNRMIVRTPKALTLPHLPGAPNVMLMNKGGKGNVINLNDPGIISYKKKKLSGGRERITIIRNEVEEDENVDELIFHGATPQPMIWHEKSPGKSKAIKILKNDDGNVEIFEDEKVWTVKEGDENVKVINEDGKIIHIREIKEGDKKKVEVKVEVEEETEKEKEQKKTIKQQLEVKKLVSHYRTSFFMLCDIVPE